MTKRAEKWPVIGWWWHHPRRFGISNRQDEKKQETAVRLEPRLKTHCYSHCPTALLLFFFIFTQTLVQLVKRDMVTAVIYCYITTEFHYAGETWLAAFHSCGFSLQVLASSSPVILLFTHFDEPKNSLELANLTRPEYSHMFNYINDHYFWWNKLAK